MKRFIALLASVALCYWMSKRCAFGVMVLVDNAFIASISFWFFAFLFCRYIGLYVSAVLEAILRFGDGK